MSESLVEIRPCLRQAVDLMEAFYDAVHGCTGIRCPSWREVGPWLADGVQKLEEDVWSLEYSPQKAVLVDQTAAIWNLAVYRNVPAIWFIRTHRPLIVLLSAICEMAEVAVSRVLNAQLEDRDFPRLTRTVGQFAGAPLRICDIREPSAFWGCLPTLFSEDAALYVVCDWRLEGEELAAAHQLGKESQISFLCPE